MVKKWFVYIASNYKNTVFYTGFTSNLQRRMWQHKRGVFENSFTKRYKIYKLLWFEEFNDPNKGIEAEKIVKDYRREKKLNLIKEMNPEFKDLMK
jgi:putative endonuclease